MAITNIPAYAHLSAADVEDMGRRLDGIRADVELSRGAGGARYIHRTIRLQRALVVGSRALLWASSSSGWLATGTVMLAVAKIIENMELGHNIVHGQWDWMNDPEIHSNVWEWEHGGGSSGG